MTQDPLITIRSCVKTNWNLTGDLAKANIKFSTGWFEETEDLLITVTEVAEDNVPMDLGWSTIRSYDTYQIDVWVTVDESTAAGEGEAKDHRWKMREEVKRIVAANKTGLTDLDYLWMNGAGRPLDEYDRDPPVLRFSLEVLTVYDN